MKEEVQLSPISHDILKNASEGKVWERIEKEKN